LSSPVEGRMRSSSEPWEALDALLEGGELPSTQNRVFKRVRLAGVCRVPTPLSAQAGVRLEDACPEALRPLLEEEKERAREEGAKRGFEEGYREGWEAARGEAMELVRAASALKEGMERARRELLERLEPEVAEMALEVGEKLALQRLDGDPECLREMVRAVISRAADRRNLRVRMHPRDLHLLAESGQELTSLFSDAEGVELVEDAGMLPGGCVVETPAGTIDARLECRRERVRKAVLPEEGAGPLGSPAPGEV